MKYKVNVVINDLRNVPRIVEDILDNTWTITIEMSQSDARTYYDILRYLKDFDMLPTHL